jgi:hypothetical protein
MTTAKVGKLFSLEYSALWLKNTLSPESCLEINELQVFLMYQTTL